MKKLAKQVGSAKKQTMGSKLSYIKKNWQLYVFFLMPALLLTIIFKYLPMGGLLIGLHLRITMSLKEFWEARGWGWNISRGFYHHRIL